MPEHATARTVLSETEGGIRTITLNRPERLNAINHALIADFNAALDDAAGDDGTHVIILRGADGYGLSIYIEDPEGNTVELKGPAEVAEG